MSPGVETSASPSTLPLPSDPWISKLVFLGTGTSGQVPAIHCVTQSDFGHCSTCQDALLPGSKNRRGCTSVVVVGHDDSAILIDCGKTFYASALAHFRRERIRRLQAVLLTHAHADAILGLDDLRAWTMGGVIQDHVDIYLTQECMDTVQGMFPYLVDRSKSTGGGDVGTLRWHVIDPRVPFDVPLATSPPLTVTPLPVLHGYIGRNKPFEAIGFRISSFAYISDCHHIPASTTALLAGASVLVLDALKMDRHLSHFSFSQALSYVCSLPHTAPELVLLTDFTHRVEHHATQALLHRWRTGLLNWAADAKTTLTPSGKGEAGGPRWWHGAWDERACEAALTVRLEPAAEAHASQPANEDAWRTSPHYIPPVLMAWDGLALSFRPPS